MARFTTRITGRSALAVTVTIPSVRFWTGWHVGIRINPGTLGATDTVIALTRRGHPYTGQTSSPIFSHSPVGLKAPAGFRFIADRFLGDRCQSSDIHGR